MSSVRVTGGSQEFLLETDRLRVAVHLNKGTFDVLTVDETPAIGLSDCASAVEVRDSGALRSRGSGFDVVDVNEMNDSRGTGVCVRLQRERDDDEPEMTLSISVYESLPYALLGIEVKKTGQP
ncbi:MAG: hypothetical protein ACE5FA_02690, partial [Dehalococcoidia bacterium]